MKIKLIKVIDGKNKWSESKDKLIHMVLDLGVYENKPSNKIEGFYERIKEHLPSLQSHRCSEGKPGGFFKRIKEGTWMGHIIEHVALELQTLAGMDTGWGRTRGVKGQKGVYNVVFNYVDKDKGRLAAREAFNVVNDIIDNKNPQIDNIVKKLKPKTKLQEHIRKVLKEETEVIPKRTPLEKTVTDFVNMSMDGYKLPENFYGVAVDITDNNTKCDITVLFKKPFNMKDSDKVHNIVRKIRQEVSNYFGESFNVRGSTSTIDSYNDNYERYYLSRK